MPGYKLYQFEHGHIARTHVVSADDDAAAIEKGRALAGDEPAELWYEKRKVKMFNAVL